MNGLIMGLKYEKDNNNDNIIMELGVQEMMGKKREESKEE